MPASLEREGIQYASSDLELRVRRSDIDDLAEQLSDDVELLKRKRSLEDVIADAGGRVHVLQPWQAQYEGEIWVHGPRDFDVVLTSPVLPRRGRFTLAHELGHYILHADCGDKPINVPRNGASVLSEWEANWFAAAFLMPKAAFKRSFERAKRRGESVLALTVEFNVSSQSVEHRIRELKLGSGLTPSPFGFVEYVRTGHTR